MVQGPAYGALMFPPNSLPSRSHSFSLDKMATPAVPASAPPPPPSEAPAAASISGLGSAPAPAQPQPHARLHHRLAPAPAPSPAPASSPQTRQQQRLETAARGCDPGLSASPSADPAQSLSGPALPGPFPGGRVVRLQSGTKLHRGQLRAWQ